MEAVTADMTDYGQHPVLLERARSVLGGIDIVLVAHGTLPDQPKAEQSWETALQALAVNQLSAMSFMLAAGKALTTTSPVPSLPRRGTIHPVIAVISSVSGDRGRQSNYIYGTAKGALTIFASGLRNSLSGQGVHVLTIKPGFVDTPMTADFKKGLLWAKPATIAQGIVRAIEKKKNVVYLPWFWRYIMLIIRAIPEPIFKKMKL